MADWISKCRNFAPAMWNFVKQPNKWGYLNNPMWTNPAKPFVKGGEHDYNGRESKEPQIWNPDRSNIVRSRGSERTHHQCGHWHLPTSDNTPEVPIDDLFVIRSGLSYGSPLGADSCYKRSKVALAEITHYGGRGSGNDQLACPSRISVDSTYAWIADWANNRLMQRLKSDLSYVQKLEFRGVGTVRAGSGSVIWAASSHTLKELSKSDLSTLRTLTDADLDGTEGQFIGIVDITSDDKFLYIADGRYHRVTWFDIETLTYQGEFGTYPYWTGAVGGITYGNGYLYISDFSFNKIIKVDPADYSQNKVFGHITGGDTDACLRAPSQMFYYNSKIYVCARDRIKIFDENLNFIGKVVDASNLYFPNAVAVDDSYIYVADYIYIRRFNVSTYAHVDSTEIGYWFDVVGIAIDAGYIYTINSDDELVVKIDKSTMAVVGSYDYSSNGDFDEPLAITIDNTYLYISDQGSNKLHRIDKLTMNYIDSLIPGSIERLNQAVIVGGSIYVADYVGGGVQEYDLSDMSLKSESPTTYGDNNFHLNPSGICCDEDYIYVATNCIYRDPDRYVGEIKIYDRTTKAYVGGFSISDYSVGAIAVDETYLYVPLGDFTVFGMTKKYLKVPPFTEIASVDEILPSSVDTQYIFQV